MSAPDAQVVAQQVAPVSAVTGSANQEIPELISKKSKEEGISANLTQAIAFCESNYRQFTDDKETVLRGLHNPLDVGIFQINEKYHLEKSKSLDFDIYTIEGNIDYALWLIKHEGAQHWKWSEPCWSKQNPVV